MVGLGVGDKEGHDDDEGEGGLDLGARAWAPKGGAAAVEAGKLDVEVMAAGVGARELEQAANVWGG